MTIAAVATILGAVGSAVSGRKAARDSGAAARARAEIAKLENARTRRNQIRQERIAQGTVLARAATAGGGFGGITSSSARGQSVGLQSQLLSNLTFLDKATALSQQASDLEVSAVEATGRAALFAGVSDAASSVGTLFNAITK